MNISAECTKADGICDLDPTVNELTEELAVLYLKKKHIDWLIVGQLGGSVRHPYTHIYLRYRFYYLLLILDTHNDRPL